MRRDPTDYNYIMGLLQTGGAADWEELAALLPTFPNGQDDFLFRRWIVNAIDCGSPDSVEWMLGQGVDLSFVDEEGRSPVHACIDRQIPGENPAVKYDLLRALIAAGADLNLRGFNGWTPLHRAAAHDDLVAIRLLLEGGADRTLRTVIDDNNDPAEEAEMLGKHEAAWLIREYTSQSIR